MSPIAITPPPTPLLAAAWPSPSQPASAGAELATLGREINANQYRVVHVAARFDEGLEWFRHGHRSASAWIAARLQIQSSTAREWIRVGHALRHLPLIDAAFASQELSYAKVRILTRWAEEDNEAHLLGLARERSANRLSVAIAKAFADGGETDAERDARLHDERSFTTWTDGDGMTVMRMVLSPSVAKPVIAAVDELVRRIAQTPMDPDDEAIVTGCRDQPDAPTDAADIADVGVASVAGVVAAVDREQTASADAFGQPSVSGPPPMVAFRPECAPADDVAATLRDMRRRWQPAQGDQTGIPSLAQQRADAVVALFLGRNVDLTTEVVIHVRGDGITFDDGAPTTGHAVLRQLDQAFIRVLVHDAERRPINASRRQRHPTTRQKRVVMEAHGHECVDCQSPDLLELDHNPSYHQTRRTVVEELEPRCAPCHRARHRRDCVRSFGRC